MIIRRIYFPFPTSINTNTHRRIKNGEKGELVEATRVFLVNEAEKTEILGWGKFLVQIACLLKNSFPYLLLRSGKSKDYETLMDECCKQFSFAHRQITEGVEDLRWNYVTFPMEVPEREA